MVRQQSQVFVLAAMLLQPAAVLVDHGHFQYNCISLGLAALAAVAIIKQKHVLGSVMYCLSLNHKQMGLFYAPAFFAHLLGRCLQQPSYGKKVSSHCAGKGYCGMTRLCLFAGTRCTVALSPSLIASYIRHTVF